MPSTEADRLSRLVKKQSRKRRKEQLAEEGTNGEAATATGQEAPEGGPAPTTKRRKERWPKEKREAAAAEAAGGPRAAVADTGGTVGHHNRPEPPAPLPPRDAHHHVDVDVHAAVDEASEADAAGLQPLLAPGGEQGARPRKEAVVERTLPRWIREPTRFRAAVDAEALAEAAPVDGGCPFGTHGIGPELASALQRNGVSQLFPVQQAVIPRLLLGHGSPVHPGDICVSAPTGSGKTLAYVLPIVQCLSQRVIRRIRAVVVLPNRDLVGQVKGVFDLYASVVAADAGRTAVQPLRIAALSGQMSFAKEQGILRSTGAFERGESKVDVVVATPGRLVDHIRGTSAITMEHVEFLVVDEADRLLSQSYSEWLPTFLAAAHRTDAPVEPPFAVRPFSAGYTVRRPAAFVRPSEHGATRWVRKLLFSATLSHDPEQLASLGLVFPTLYVADGRLNRHGARKPVAGAAVGDEGAAAPMDSDIVAAAGHFTIPATLSEHMVVCGAQHKPLVVLYFLLVKKLSRVLVFVSSRESAKRLTALLNFYDGVTCEEFTSTLTSQQRRGIITRFNDGQLDVVVCSDAMARGMDLGQVETVISYDPPVAPQTYVHRVGRTARAGADGSSYVLLRRQEVLHFKKLHREIDDTTVPMVNLKSEDYDEIPGDYNAALVHLKEQVQVKSRAPRGRMALVHASLVRRAQKGGDDPIE